MTKKKIATIWLDGCSGCHMSLLDIDERLIEVAKLADFVYSPIVDPKEFPEMVDVCLVEGAVSNQDDLEKIKKIRKHSKIIVALGDCAVTTNVPGMRNQFKLKDIYSRAYLENAAENKHKPDQVIPALLEKSLPVHQVVEVDVFVPGCPPSADTIYYTLLELLNGRIPDLQHKTRFGA